jgi:hypothetical protein
MEPSDFQLAQLNVARARWPIDDPSMAGFVALLEDVYAAAERAEGFVWRLRAQDLPAGVRVPSDPRLFVTLSVWESIRALHDYVYRGDHRDSLRRRAEWFEPAEGPAAVLWWIPRGTLPRPEQGLARIKYLQRNGPTPRAFTFKDWFPPPGQTDRAPLAFDYEGGADD